MDRVFEFGASASPPIAPVSPSSGYPTAGNPAGGTPATKPGAWWYHMITEELLAIVTAASITPDHEDTSQLLMALRSAGVFPTQPTNDSSTKAATTAFANPGASLSASGWQKLPSGLILQWQIVGGLNLNTTAQAVAVTFPISYPTASLLVLPAFSNAAFGNVFFTVSANSQTGFTLRHRALETINGAGAWVFSLGY